MNAPDPSDPRWFPVGYAAETQTLSLLKVDLDCIGRSSFLDRRMQADWSAALPVPLAALAESAAVDRAPALLFHTAFCGSTLLARALHAPPLAVSLKEPSALLDLCGASLPNRRVPPERIERAGRALLGLLGRPWTAGGRVLIKPTNQVNRLLPLLLRLSPRSRAVLLYSGLEQFLVSCCKKLPEAETKLRWMAQMLLPDSRLGARLGIPSDHPFNFVESSVLTWHLQMERYALALAADGADRLRTLSVDALLAEPEASVRQAARWLELPGALDGLSERVQATFSRDAKHPEREYGQSDRENESQVVRQQHAALIEFALRWAAAAIEPAACLPADWKPLLPHRAL